MAIVCSIDVDLYGARGVLCPLAGYQSISMTLASLLVVCTHYSSSNAHVLLYVSLIIAT
jgi:hypothetical protein